MGSIARSIGKVRQAEGFVAAVAGIELPARVALRRTAPRPVALRDEHYDQLFDWTWLFHDVFVSSGRIMMPGPPLRNLQAVVERARLSFDGRAPAGEVRTIEMDRCQRTTIAVDGSPSTLVFEANDFRQTVRIQQDHLEVFAERMVLVTKNRDNELEWIVDWVEYHVKAHGTDAVLIYDNGSTRYTPAELLERVLSIVGIVCAVIVPWPYSFGPQGGREAAWDSDYCEYVILEHARYRFLMRAQAVLQIDIDELVVCASKKSVFWHLLHSPAGALSFDGGWVEGVVRTPPPQPARHRHFRYMRKVGQRCAPKWAVIPARIPAEVQWKVHLLEPDFVPSRDPGITFRHFRAISTNWKYRRTDAPPYDRSQHVIDRAWVRQMTAIGWAPRWSSPNFGRLGARIGRLASRLLGQIQSH